MLGDFSFLIPQEPFGNAPITSNLRYAVALPQDTLSKRTRGGRAIMLSDTGEGGAAVDIAIETDNRQAIDALRGIDGVEDALTTERRGADGATLVTMVLTLTPPIIAAIVAIVRAEIAAKRYVKVTRKGMVIQGISEETLMKILHEEAALGRKPD